MRQSRISPSIWLDDKIAEAELTSSLMCINAMKLLVYASDHGGIPLTKAGAFYRKCVVWAVEEFAWLDHEPEQLYAVNRVLNEQDFMPLAVMHDLLLDSRLLRHFKGRAILTKAGRRIMGDYGALQAELFDTHFLMVMASNYDWFGVELGEADLLQQLRIIQRQLDDWVTLGECAGWCIPPRALPEARMSPEAYASMVLMSRLIRPLLWLGLLEQGPDQSRTRIESRVFRKTPLFDRFMRLGVTASSDTIH